MKNNTIALMTGILIIISIAVIVSPRPLFYLSTLTGHSTENSTITLNLTQETSILVAGAINFGVGNVYSNASFAILDSELGTGGSSSVGWQNVTGITGAIPLVTGFRVVYDSGRGVFILYGGGTISEGYSSNETWQFNYSSKQWTNLTDLSSVPQQVLTDMVYDSSIDAIILYGGFPGNVGDCGMGCGSNETWKFNSSQKWEKLNTVNAPPAVQYPNLVFDSNRNVTVLFGGLPIPNSGDNLNETWEFNASSNTWTNKTNGASPPAMIEHLMAFDSNRNVVVLFGGINSDGDIRFTDTWEYNGTEWVNRTLASSPSPPRSSAGMTFDSARNKIVLAGGVISLEEEPWAIYLNETWEYNGTDWANVTTFSNARGVDNVVFDLDINKSLLFFGSNETDTLYDLQEYGTLGSGGEEGGGCINGTWVFGPSFIYVENDGTVNISIDYTANKAAGTFIGGTSPSFKIKGVVDEAGACLDLNTTYAEVSDSTPNEICPVLKYQNDADRFKIPSRLVVPADVSPGEHNSTITLSATQVGGPA